MIIYIIIFIVSSLILSFLGLDIISAMGACVASLSNVGPSIGEFGPIETYASLSNGIKYFLAFLMLVGRLEIFTLLIIFTPMFWRK
ncbi:MAG: hypothetical protein GX879_10345 [Bacteroidales bacterium]|nr:hypothetical protein [Bacteroidales bacterium]